MEPFQPGIWPIYSVLLVEAMGVVETAACLAFPQARCAASGWAPAARRRALDAGSRRVCGQPQAPAPYPYTNPYTNTSLLSRAAGGHILQQRDTSNPFYSMQQCSMCLISHISRRLLSLSNCTMEVTIPRSNVPSTISSCISFIISSACS